MFNEYKKFYGFLLKYKLRYGLFLVFLVVMSVTESVQPYFYKLFVDAVTNPNSGTVFVVLAWYFVVRISHNISTSLAHWSGDTVLLPSSRDARISVVKKIQDLDMAFHLSKSTGSLISNIKRGDSAFFDTFENIHFGIIRILVSLVVMAFAFNQISPWFVVVSLFTFFANIFVAKSLIFRNLKTRQEFNDEEDKLSALITDNLLNYETVKLFAKEKRLKDSFVVWLSKLWAYSNSFRALEIALEHLAIFPFLFCFL